MDADPDDVLIDFQGHGISFRYPGYWELEEEQDGDDLILTVAADNSCFWLLRLFPECPRTEQVLSSCLNALREEYDDVEEHEFRGTLANLTANCREVTFSCFELLNAAGFRCIQSHHATILVWWQCTDHELDSVRPVFDRITQSVRILPGKSPATDRE